MTQSTLALINSNDFYVERALEATCKGKVFIVADLHNNKIASFNRTIKGAESYVKNDAEYYRHYTARNTSPVRIEVVTPLQIVEIDSNKIRGYDPDCHY